MATVPMFNGKIAISELQSNDGNENYGCNTFALPNGVVFETFYKTSREGVRDGHIMACKGVKSGDSVSFQTPYVLQGTVGGFSVNGPAIHLDKLGYLNIYYFVYIDVTKVGVIYRRKILASLITATSIDVWSDPVVVPQPGRDGLLAVGGIVREITAGTYAGRLIMSAEQIDQSQTYTRQTLLYSDDDGINWVQGGAIDESVAGYGEGAVGIKSNGAIYILMRNNTSGAEYLSYTTSVDGGVTLAAPQTSTVVSPIHHANFAPLSDGRWVMLWNNRRAQGPTPRNPYTVAITSDDFATWTKTADVAMAQTLANTQLHNGSICQLLTGDIIVSGAMSINYATGSSIWYTVFPLSALDQNNISVKRSGARIRQVMVCNYNFVENKSAFGYIIPVSKLDSSIVNASRIDGQDICIYDANGKLLNREIKSFNRSAKTGFIEFESVCTIGAGTTFTVETGSRVMLCDNKAMHNNLGRFVALGLHEGKDTLPAYNSAFGYFAPIDVLVGNASWKSGTVSYLDGVLGKNHRFSVDGSITFERYTELEQTQNKNSFECIVSRESGVFQILFAKFASGLNYYGLYIGADNLIYWQPSNTAGNAIISAPTVGTKIHLSGTFDGTQSSDLTKVKMYKNGVPQTPTFAGGAIGTTLPNETAKLCVGNAYASYASGWDGTLEEMNFYNRVLSDAEIAAYNAFKMSSLSQWTAGAVESVGGGSGQGGMSLSMSLSL